MEIDRSKRAAILLAAAVAAGSLLSFDADGATTRTWSNAAGGAFETGTNWLGGVVAGSGEVAYFNLNSSDLYHVTLSANRTTLSLDVANDNLEIDLNGKTYNATSAVHLGVNANNVSLLTLSDGTLTTPQILVANSTGSNADLSLFGGNANVGTVVIGAIGNATVSAISTLHADILTVGDGTASNGYVSVYSSGSWTVNAQTSVGNYGDGTVSVGFGGKVHSSSVTLGVHQGGEGTIQMGNSTSWTDTGLTKIGDEGNGVLTVQNSGVFQGSLALLAYNGGTGTLNITNHGQWKQTDDILIGFQGAGTVNVNSGGSFTAVGFTLGDVSGGNGRLIVKDPGSAAVSTGSIVVGHEGNGTINISNGGFVAAQANDATFASAVTGSAAITVDGVGSAFSVGNILHLGESGPASMNISNGGLVTVSSAVLGGTTVGRGTITLTGNGSAFNCSNGLDVAGGSFSGGTSVVTIGTGATATIGAMHIWTPGSVNLTGGTLSVATVTMSGGAFNWSSGTVLLSGAGSTQIGASAPFNLPIDLVAGKTLRGSGTLALASGGVILIDGGNLFAGGLSIASGAELQLNSQSSQASINGQISNTGLISGDGRIAGALTNNLGGEVRADSGDHLKFLGNGSSAFNSGKLTMFDGTLEFVAPVTNSATGKLQGHGRFASTNLNNSGTVSLSTGVSDVIGPVVNNNGGKVIVTGASQATFYDAVTNNTGSEFRVSSDSSATFLSPVVGLAQFTGAGVKFFEAGASGGALATMVGDSVVDGSSSLAASRIHEDELDVFGVAQVTPNGASATTSRLNTLLIGGVSSAWAGKLDLSDNALVLDYTGASPLPTVLNQLMAGRSGGAWTGNGIASSTAASVAANASDPHKTALGFAEASSLGLTIFGGQTLDPTALLVRYTYLGDANLDGKVNAMDFNAVATNFGAASGTLWNQGDFNFDGVVNTADFTMLGINFNQVLPGPALGSLDFGKLSSSLSLRAEGSRAVPEPCLAMVGVLVLLIRRRRPKTID